MWLRSSLKRCTEVLSLFVCFDVMTIYCHRDVSGPKFVTRIVRGTPAEIEKFPWSVQFINDGSFCGASVLNSFTVLTAAHCFDPSKDTRVMMIMAGSTHTYDPSAVFYDVNSFQIHPDFREKLEWSGDVALVFVTDSIKFNNKTKKAVIVNNGSWMNDGVTILVGGWGQTEYNGEMSLVGFQWIAMKYMSRKRCEVWHQRDISDDMFCLYAKDKSPCKGDSGGGVIWKGMLVGVVSHGVQCGQTNTPAIFANVYLARNWIENATTQYMLNCRKK